MMHQTKIRGLPLDLEVKEAPKDDPIADLTKAFDEHNSAVQKIGDDVKSWNVRVDELEKKLNRLRLAGGGGGDGPDPAALAEEQKAIGLYIRTGDESGLKAYSVGEDAAGGFLVPTQRSRMIMKRLFDKTPMRRLSRVITLTIGDSFEEPVDPSDVGAAWVGETEARPETSSGEVGVHDYDLNEIYALQKVTQKLLDTSDYDVGAWIDDKIADKFARMEGIAFVTGDGIRKPRGFLTRETSADADSVRPWGTLQFINSGSATAVTADALRDAYWSLKAAYRQSATWLMASSTANAIDKLKDGNGDYLWRSGQTAGAPPSLLGRPVEFDENMPIVSAGNFPIAFGDFKVGYTIVDKAGLRPLRDPYTAKPHVLFYTYKRVTGDMSNSEAIKLLKIAAS